MFFFSCFHLRETLLLLLSVTPHYDKCSDTRLLFHGESAHWKCFAEITTVSWLQPCLLINVTNMLKRQRRRNIANNYISQCANGTSFVIVVWERSPKMPQNTTMYAQQAWFDGVHLFSRLHFAIAFQEVALNDRAHNGQTLACLQLRHKSEHSGIFYMEVFIQLQQHQQLRSVSHSEKNKIKKSNSHI